MLADVAPWFPLLEACGRKVCALFELADQPTIGGPKLLHACLRAADLPLRCRALARPPSRDTPRARSCSSDDCRISG
ncbi:hypothetical protein FCG19_13015 [Xanthomonas hortorum pv. vitians]|nr:hypothetical protein [Xanthomonas hortorum pv. vitians]